MRSALQIVYPDLVIPPASTFLWHSPEIAADPRLWHLAQNTEVVMRNDVRRCETSATPKPTAECPTDTTGLQVAPRTKDQVVFS